MRRLYTLIQLLALSSLSIAMDKPGYRLTLDTRVENHQLTMAPQINAPKGSVLRYEVVADKTGSSGNTSTRQGGQVKVDDASATLSTFSLSLRPGDSCTVSVRVYDGANVVAERTIRCPATAE